MLVRPIFYPHTLTRSAYATLKILGFSQADYMFEDVSLSIYSILIVKIKVVSKHRNKEVVCI